MKTLKNSIAQPADNLLKKTGDCLMQMQLYLEFNMHCCKIVLHHHDGEVAGQNALSLKMDSPIKSGNDRKKDGRKLLCVTLPL
jgi:hypothetical protein